MRAIVAIVALSCGLPGGPQSTHQALGPSAPLPLSWVAVGDSTTMDLADSTQGWPTQLGADWLAHDVWNIAIPGSTIIDGGPGFPTVVGQWTSVRTTMPRGLLQGGGFNEMIRDYTGEEIFGHMLLVANDAADAGWTVVFAAPLPCGGNCDNNQDGKRRVIMGLQAAWNDAHGWPYLNFDDSPINCGDLFGNGVATLCDWARFGGTDVIHPSPEAQRVLGQWGADRLAAPELLAP